MTTQIHTVLQELCLGMEITTQGNYVTLILVLTKYLAYPTPDAAINLRLRRVGDTDLWEFKMAVILYSGNLYCSCLLQFWSEIIRWGIRILKSWKIFGIRNPGLWNPNTAHISFRNPKSPL